MKSLLLALGFILAACDGASVSPSPTTTTIPAPPSPPPRVDQPFSWSGYRGISQFALLAHSNQEIVATVTANVARGWTAQRVCAETEFWDGAYPYLQVRRNAARLREGLDTIARIPNASVLLIANCTLKRQVSIQEQEEWNAAVAKVARDFRNVAIEVINEGDNCRSRDDWGGQVTFCAGKQDWARWVHAARSAGVKNVTLDDSVCVGDFTLEFRFRNIGAAPADFHPCRNDPRSGKPWDPDSSFLEKLLAANGGLVLLSETVAYSEVECGGLRTCDRNRVQRAADACAAASGCLFTYHSAPWGLAGEAPEWYPAPK